MTRGPDQAVDMTLRASEIPEELRDSTEKILVYSGIPQERADQLRINLESYRRLKDKSMFDTESRKVREAVSAVFFEVYESVSKKVLAENNNSRLYQMFLRFGYMDEKLLKPEQTIELYELVNTPMENRRVAVFDTKDWMESIYKREKDPSINEYGYDYYDVFREKKKRGELTDRDKVPYENDIDGRLQHEVNNLLRLGQRICCGQMSVYFPILHSGMIHGNIAGALITPEKIEERLNKILEVDFSAFHRELVYSNRERGIEKELIMKSVLPDFILIPTFGTRAVMWQELTGRVRNSPGRILFPVFTSENVDNLMVEVVARFRWELSKTMYSYVSDGSGSLVSDYIDYLQVYRKNRDLSDNARQKIKTQVEKYRNNAGEIFADDYSTWINYEAKGLIRINKVARAILFKHCPFSKTIRENLEKQPLYNQLVVRFNNQQNKQAKLTEARYTRLNKPGLPIDPELMNNLIYYKM